MLIQPGRVFASNHLDALEKIRRKYGNGSTSIQEVPSPIQNLRWFDYYVTIEEEEEGDYIETNKIH